MTTGQLGPTDPSPAESFAFLAYLRVFIEPAQVKEGIVGR
jgi:hypothetical protein